MADKPTLGLGKTREWLSPLGADGRRFRPPTGEDIVGCHTGISAGLNGRNLKPGFEYMWGNNDPRNLLLYTQAGWEIVPESDPDGPAWRSEAIPANHNAPTQMDTGQVYKDVVFLRIPSVQLAQIREAEDARAAQAVDAAARNFVGSSTEGEFQAAQGRSPRFIRPGHSRQIMDGDEIVQQFVPEGLPRE